MKRLLPNGSVVLLKDMEQRIMTYGRLQKDVNTGEIYDYAGCPYPQGIRSSNEVLLFNDDAIERLFFIGFQDPEELEYQIAISDWFENAEAGRRDEAD